MKPAAGDSLSLEWISEHLFLCGSAERPRVLLEMLPETALLERCGDVCHYASAIRAGAMNCRFRLPRISTMATLAISKCEKRHTFRDKSCCQ
jgi:hypothetical protein